MSKKDAAKIAKKISRETNKLPKGKIVTPNKKEYKRKPKHCKVVHGTECECVPTHGNDWMD